MNSLSAFDLFTDEYEEWFERHKLAYLSEVEALRKALPPVWKDGLEIGVGTGRFAQPLGIKLGIDPSERMLELARARGIETVLGKGEELPFPNERFDVVLLAFTICFVEDPVKVLVEAKRVLKQGGRLIIGIIDKDSRLGKIYQARKNESKFYSRATFYSAEEIIEMLRRLELKNINALQTLFNLPDELKEIEEPKEGYGEGSFVVIYGEK